MALKKLYPIALALIFSSLSTVSCQSKKSPQLKIVQKQEVKEMLKKVEREEIQLLDVRTVQEFERGALPGALNVNIKSSDFEEKVLLLDKEKPVLIYCQAGYRSNAASKKLEELGFMILYDYSGGYKDWVRQE